MKTPIYTGIFQSDLDATGYKLVNLPTPTASGDAANKAYVDAHGGGGGGGTAREFDVKTYGAVGDGTTDDTTAIQDALADIPSTGGVLYFPAGQYKYAGATLTLDRQITVRGDGGGVQYVFSGGTTSNNGALAISTIDFASSTVPLFTVTVNGCAFRNLGLRNTSVTAPSAGAGILVSAGGDRTLYESISVDGFYNCIDVQAGSGQVFKGCWIAAPCVYGIKLRNVLQPDGGDHFISDCYICAGGAGRTPLSAIRIESGGGVKIINCKTNVFTSATLFWHSVDLAVVDGITTSDLLVSNCSFEGYSVHGIKGTIGTSHWANILITGNQFLLANAISLVAASSGGFHGITIVGNWAWNPFATADSMLTLTNCTNVVLGDNGHEGFGDYLTATTSTFVPVYIGPDLRLVSITGGGKLQTRNPGTNTWADADQWTNP